MAGSSWSVQNFWNPSGAAVPWAQARGEWAAQGYDLDPAGNKTKISAPAASAPAQQSPSIGGFGKTMGMVGLGGSPGTPAQGGASMSGGAGGVNTGNTSLADLTNIADPWSSQRGQYQTQLSSLMKDPSSFLKSDLFKASTAAGLEGVNRSAAAGGMLKSGNRLQALMDYGQKNAPDNFFRMADLLSGFGGAKNQNPGGGLSAFANLQNANTGAYNADTSRRAQESSASIGQFNADTARQGNAQQAQNAQTAQQQWQQQQDSAQQRWQQQQQQQSMADLQRQMEEQRNFAMNYR